MKNKILMLDSPFFGEPFKFGIEMRLDYEVDLINDMDEIVEAFDQNDYSLIISDPYQFPNPKNKSSLIPLFEESKKRSIPVVLHTVCQEKEMMQNMYGVEKRHYDEFHIKVSDFVEVFYDLVKKYVEK